LGIGIDQVVQRLAVFLQQHGDQAGPAGLVAGAQAIAVIAMKIFIEQDQLAPVRVRQEQRLVAVERAAALLDAQEEADQAVGQVVGDLRQRHHLA
jgi:hypothetical protein